MQINELRNYMKKLEDGLDEKQLEEREQNVIKWKQKRKAPQQQREYFVLR